MLKASISFIITLLTLLPGVRICFSAQTSVVARRSGDLSTMQLVNVKIDTQNVTSFFAHLSLTYHIPVGLEIATNENESTRYYTELENGTLAELLTKFVDQHPQYTWTIEDGVVNIFPQDSFRDLLSKDLLAVKIERFSVKEKTSCWNFVASLLDRPETKSILKANDTTYSRRTPSGFYIPQLGRSFSLNVSELTVKSILNRVISKSSTAKFWVVTRNLDGTLFLDVSAQHEDSVNTKGKHPLQDLVGEKPKQ